VTAAHGQARSHGGLNKIDGQWDELKTQDEIDAEISAR
jgi:hypothetical protein